MQLASAALFCKARLFPVQGFHPEQQLFPVSPAVFRKSRSNKFTTLRPPDASLPSMHPPYFAGSPSCGEFILEDDGADEAGGFLLDGVEDECDLCPMPGSPLQRAFELEDPAAEVRDLHEELPG